MEKTIFIVAAVIAMLLYVLGGKLYRFFLFARKINKIPSLDLPIPLLGAPYLFVQIPKEDQLEWLRNRTSRYKDGCYALWILAHGIVNFQKPEPVEALLRSSEQLNKSIFYDILRPWLGQGLLTLEGSKYFHHRKVVTPSFSYATLEEFSEVMIEKAAIFRKCLEREKKIHGDEPFDIFKLSLKCALDIVCETSIGVNIHAQEQDNSGYVQSVGLLTLYSYCRILTPWFSNDWVYYKTSQGRDYAAALKTANSFCDTIIHRKLQERKAKVKVIEETAEFGMEDKPKRKSFLDLLLEASEKENDPLTFEEIRDHTQSLMFAGHDTTGALIGWTFFCLGNEPVVQRKVHEELDEVLGDLDDLATLKQMPNLKYLERVLKEVLRLFPSVTAIGRTITQDFQTGNHLIPEGATALIHIYNLHRDPDVWPDPERFDPDRFLPENVKARHPFAWVPFSGGPRGCMGHKYAILEAKVVLSKVLRKFSVKSVDSYSTMKLYSALVLKPSDGVYVKLSKRSPTVE